MGTSQQMINGSLSADPFSFVLSSNTLKFSLGAALTGQGWDGVSPVQANITVNSGVYVWSDSVASAALTVGALPAGSGVSIVNNGYIIGMGGAGGNGTGSPTAGQSGGHAISIACNVSSVTNNSGAYIAGGGGGGAPSTNYFSSPAGGGGGGAGGGAGGTSNAGAGGAGGGLGATGANGATLYVSGQNAKGGGSGGGGGAADSSGGGGGRILPGTGGAGVNDGGSPIIGGNGGSAGSSGGTGPGAGGGGGWGAAGGTGGSGLSVGQGGKAIALNGFIAPLTNSGNVYGAIS